MKKASDGSDGQVKVCPLKHFRDIPEADLNTRFPNRRVIVNPIDKAMIAVVGGVLILLNIVPALSVPFLTIGACVTPRLLLRRTC